MAAPQKNSNAKKWTEEKLLTYLAQIEQAASKPENLFLGKQLTELGLYKDIWAYWKHKFEDKDEIMEQIYLIETMFESNLFRAALFGEIPAHVAILSLKNAHGWSEYPTEMEEPDESILRLVHSRPGPVRTGAQKSKTRNA